jgi:hypothetical protein
MAFTNMCFSTTCCSLSIVTPGETPKYFSFELIFNDWFQNSDHIHLKSILEPVALLCPLRFIICQLNVLNIAISVFQILTIK